MNTVTLNQSFQKAKISTVVVFQVWLMPGGKSLVMAVSSPLCTGNVLSIAGCMVTKCVVCQCRLLWSTMDNGAEERVVQKV